MATKKKPAHASNERTAATTKRASKTAASPKAKAISPALEREVELLLYRQSELLDAKQWAGYIDLFTDDGVYWAPSLPEHTHWDGKPAIFIEDKDLMTVRMKRVAHPNAWSQQAEWATNHVVSNIAIESIGRDGSIHVRSRFHMMEMRRDDLRHFGGTYRHTLKRTKDGLRIQLQRVDLFNAQAAYEYVLQVWV
jgi:3-phenylpropionate/cinnamic acid dioxygenase small subunit